MSQRIVVIAFFISVCGFFDSGRVHANEDWLAEHRAWQKARLERLIAPDGWLTLVGLHWLPANPNGLSIGAGAGNDLRLRAGPERLGVLAWQDGQLRLEQLQQLPDNLSTDPESTLWTGDAGLPARLEYGPWSVELIERDGRLALRERHADAQTRSGFAGLEAYPADSQWRLVARFLAHEPPRTMRMSTVAGVDDLMANPGVLLFELDDVTYTLEALQFEGGEQLFIVFADRSSGRTTYGGGRFVYTDLPDQQGRVLLDFNRAYNPPCVFTDYSTCPLPPPGNRLDLEITAGERLPPGQL